MLAYEFNSIVEDKGIIHIPEQYLQNISSSVKVIILANEETQNPKKKHFTSMKIKLGDFKFDRDAANER